MQRRKCKAERAARKAARKIKQEERLLRAMFVMAHNYQVHPVYPSNTDNLEWIDPTPESDCKYPRSPDNQRTKSTMINL
jgi:hypothetical protein